MVLFLPSVSPQKYVHFKALGDSASVSHLLYNLRDTSERYNMPDFLKAQFTAHLTTEFSLGEYKKYLESIKESSAEFKRRQEAAFEEGQVLAAVS